MHNEECHDVFSSLDIQIKEDEMGMHVAHIRVMGPRSQVLEVLDSLLCLFSLQARSLYML
jgi:hypothetical protein